MAEKKTIVAVAAGLVIAGGVIAIAYFATRPKTPPQQDIMKVTQPVVATPDKTQKSVIQTPGLNVGKVTIIVPKDLYTAGVIVLKKASTVGPPSGIPYVGKWEAPHGQWLSGAYAVENLPMGDYIINYDMGVDYKTIGMGFGIRNFTISPTNLNPVITLEAQ